MKIDVIKKAGDLFSYLLSNHQIGLLAEPISGFLSYNGCILSKSKKTLFYAPDDNGIFVLPDSVTTLSHNCFSSTNYTQIVMPSVQIVQEHAFFNSGIQEIIAPQLQVIRSFAFDQSKLQEFHSETVCVLENHAFCCCDLKRCCIISRDNDVSIYNAVFQDSAIENAFILASHLQFGLDVFDGCNNLQRLEIYGAETLTSKNIGNCPNLETLIVTQDCHLDINDFPGVSKIGFRQDDGSVLWLKNNGGASI